jgi:hypothetical protein
MSSARFLQSSIEALEIKLENPSLTLLVSIESSPSTLDEFWAHPLVVSVLNPNFLVVRLYISRDSDEIAQFRDIYPMDRIPALVVLGPGSDSVTLAWTARWPSHAEFYTRFAPGYGSRPSARTVRLSAIAGERRVLQDFQPSDNLLAVRTWLEREFGGDWRVIVSHTRLPLPADDSMTVVSAGLAPSAVLRLHPIESGREAPLGLPQETLQDLRMTDSQEIVPPMAEVENRAERGWNWTPWGGVKAILSLCNPWPNVEEREDFFERKD